MSPTTEPYPDAATDWTAFRAHFPAVRNYLYADSAAVGALPGEAVDVASSAFGRLSERGMGAYLELKAEAETVREQAVQFFGAASTDDIGFTDCTSTSMNMLAMMARQEWQGGGADRNEVVLLKEEFPSSTLGWMHQGFTPKWVEPEPDFTYPVGKILDAVGSRTRAVITSQVQYQTGVRLNVEALSRELAGRGVWHIVNSTQSAGVIPQAAAAGGFTALTATAVKWLCSGLGTGIVYLSPELRNSCRMPVIGWMAQQDPFAMINSEVQLRTVASALETGATDPVRLHVLGVNLRLMMTAGTANIHRRVLDLNGRLADELRNMGETVLTPTADEHRAGIVSVRHGHARAWSVWAKEHNVLHSVRGDTVLRFSLHYFNNSEDVDHLVALWPNGPKSAA